MDSDDAVRLLSGLAQKNRLDAVRFLIARGARGASAGVLAEHLGAPGSTTSFHLSALERAGLIVAARDGRQIVYAARVAAIRDLLAFLAESCGAGRLDAGRTLARLLPRIPEEAERKTMTPSFNVLFLCTQNSARSIMAEAVLAQAGRERFRAYSAGSHPVAAPLPEVIEKLRALGHDVAGLRSKSWDEFTRPDAPRMDFVIALCDTVRNQVCPDFGDSVVTGAWPLPDPAKFSGSAAERQTLLNELYSGLRRRIEIFVSLPFATLDALAMKARLDEIGAGPAPAGPRATAR